MKKHTTKTQIRQGDILLNSIDSIPAGAKLMKAEQGRLILARGEVTGHHHSIAKGATTALYATADDELYLLVKEGTALLEHQEHGTIPLPPGAYKVTRQREYVPKALPRQVID